MFFLLTFFAVSWIDKVGLQFVSVVMLGVLESHHDRTVLEKAIVLINSSTGFHTDFSLSAAPGPSAAHSAPP